jgi:hypothetical protein
MNAVHSKRIIHSHYNRLELERRIADILMQESFMI